MRGCVRRGCPTPGKRPARARGRRRWPAGLRPARSRHVACRQPDRLDADLTIGEVVDPLAKQRIWSPAGASLASPVPRLSSIGSEVGVLGRGRRTSERSALVAVRRRGAGIRGARIRGGRQDCEQGGAPVPVRVHAMTLETGGGVANRRRPERRPNFPSREGRGRDATAAEEAFGRVLVRSSCRVGP